MDDKLDFFLMGMILGIVIMSIMVVIMGYTELNQEVQDEICQKLATYEGNFSNETIPLITSEVEDGELVCIYPSFDHTQKIKFRSNVE